MTMFINPYNFVRGGDRCDKTSPPTTHERFHSGLYSGKLLDCKVETITRLSTKGLSEGNCIYGSSLKGMIRSVAEAIAQGCRVIGKPCTNKDHLCIGCRMFGWLKGGDIHLGRVAISDAKPPQGNWREIAYISEHALSAPKPERHACFYPANGHKFYYHQNPEQTDRFQARIKEGREIRVAKAGCQFSFEVDFADLTGPELGLLLYALLLEEGWYHKLGYGKPLGFGTVKITVGSIELRPQDYYENWEVCFHLPESVSQEDFIKDHIEGFFQYQFGRSQQQAEMLGHWCDLRDLLTLHPGYTIHYPSQQWFKKYHNHKLPTPAEIEVGPDNWLPEE